MISPLRSLADVNPGNAYLWTEFRTQFDVAGVRKCENLARHPLAPRLLTLGDGSTAATIPAQLVGRHGLVFTGTQYVDTGIVDPFERTDRFTFVTASQVSTVSGGGDIVSSIDQAQSTRGLTLTTNASETLTAYIISGSGNSIVRTVSPVGAMASFQITAMTCNGSSLASGINIYLNGSLAVANVVADTLSATIKNGKPFLLGARHNGANKTSFFSGTMHFAAIFPWEFSAQQVQYLHRQVMTRINAA